MRKNLIFILALLLFAPLHAEETGHVYYLTTEQFRSQICDYTTQSEWHYLGDKPCVIDFYTTWCGPCKRLAPIMAELSEEYCDQVIFYKVDTEKEPELAYMFNIQSIPQVLYVPMQGKPTIAQGLYPKDQIQSIIEEYLLKK